MNKIQKPSVDYAYRNTNCTLNPRIQVCDIQDSRCQAVLRTFETDVFTHEDGFYSKGAIHAVRKVMTEQFKDFLKKRKEGSPDVQDDEMT